MSKMLVIDKGDAVEHDGAMRMEQLFHGLEPEQQDHLFYALDWARSAAREYYEIEFGTSAPRNFELALAAAYAELLQSDELDQIGMR